MYVEEMVGEACTMWSISHGMSLNSDTSIQAPRLIAPSIAECSEIHTPTTAKTREALQLF